jgi:hypothetical protein
MRGSEPETVIATVRAVLSDDLSSDDDLAETSVVVTSTAEGCTAMAVVSPTLPLGLPSAVAEPTSVLLDLPAQIDAGVEGPSPHDTPD